MIITVGNIKGGVGKSTVACNLAVLLSAHGSKPVALIDGDKQGSSAEFTEARNARGIDAGFTCVRAQGAEVRQQAKGLAETFGHVIVDAGGQDNPALRAALTVADMVLIPVPPKSFEAWSLEVMADLVQEVRETVNPDLKALAFINMGFPTGDDNTVARALIAEDYTALQALPSVICSRKAFSNGAGQGLAVTETTPRDTKAISEFMAVMEDAGLLQNNVASMLG
jgi:chromosome partitioning protein